VAWPAGGQQAFGILVFTAMGHHPQMIGTLTALQPRLGEPPNVLDVLRVGPGLIVAVESFYGTHDPNCCCPSGRATDEWRFRAGKLSPGVSRIKSPAD
jgi:hypothetical protein